MNRGIGTKVMRLLATVCLAQAVLGNAWGQERTTPQGRSSNALQEKISSEQRALRPTLIEADVISGTPDIELKLQGNATLRRADTLIRADRINYDIEQDRMHAFGSVRLNRSGNVFEGTELDLSVDAFSGFFSKPSYRFLRGGGYGQASRIEFIDDQRAVARDANYTTCTAQPGPGWLPEWIIKATRLDLDNERNEARARGATLRFKDVTVPVPDISFPLNENRKSGLLPPLIGVDTINGLTYIQPYYINLAPNRDATLTTNVYARRGVSLGGEFRYLESTLPDTRGEIRLNYMPQDELRGGQRWSYAQQHTGYTQLAGQDLRLNVNLNRVSDDNYWKDFPFSFGALNQRLLPADFQLSSTRGEWTTSLRSLRWQTIQDVNSPLTPPYNRSPQVQVQYNRFGESWDVGWTNDLTAFSADRMQACLSSQTSSSANVQTDCQPNANRLVSQFRLARPIQTGGLTLTPKLMVTGRQYEYEGAGMGADGSRYAQAQTLPTFSLDAMARFERNTTLQGRDWIQTLEPRAFFVHTPYRDQSMFPLYDSARYDFNFATVFTENAYSGYDRIADNRLLTLGAITRFLNPADGSEGARFGIAQRLRLKEQQVLLPNEVKLNDRLSDLLLGATINLNRQWLIDSTVQFNPKTNTSERSAIGARYNPSPYRLVNVSYRNQTQFQSELIDIAWQWPLNDLWGDRGKNLSPGQGQGDGRWYSVARMNYSLQDKRLIDTLMGLEYDAGCWLGRVVVQQQQLGVLVNNRRIMFQLEFSGFGRVGANPLQQLQTQIPRYQMLRDTRLTPPSRFGLYD
ncbi:MAG: LPS assembly protein LptD [Alphaproteobacteria bacterium]|nr:LPS assembly protein LptD [Alphaproteobacteria bacterium]